MRRELVVRVRVGAVARRCFMVERRQLACVRWTQAKSYHVFQKQKKKKKTKR
jgi:hypothetical protein